MFNTFIQFSTVCIRPRRTVKMSNQEKIIENSCVSGRWVMQEFEQSKKSCLKKKKK